MCETRLRMSDPRSLQLKKFDDFISEEAVVGSGIGSDDWESL